jgi:hypothetical protein
MNKRGQFYLIAAVIIVGILVAAAGVSNYVRTRQVDTDIKDLEEELRLESENIVNSGMFNDEELGEKLEIFAEQYAEYIGSEYDLLFVYGDEETIARGYLNVIFLFSSSSSITYAIGDSSSGLDIETRTVDTPEIQIQQSGESNIIRFKIDDKNYNFEITEGQNFFFIIEEPLNKDE